MPINLCNWHRYIGALASFYSLLDAYWIRLLYCTTIFVRALLSLFLRLCLPRSLQLPAQGKPHRRKGMADPQ
jgi:hypothetical protein